ncbi:MAG: NAD-dependent deacylase [Phycisphaerae bacterium]|nr:NAD-dependent deacylase [Phycisphaerae bacterium]
MREVDALNPIEQLAGFLRDARHAVVFTGAGMSTESGISDFRSPGGVWSKHQPVYYDDFMRSRAERVRYWKMRQEMYAEFRGARPNDGHRAIARLEDLGRIVAVITQNIDGLHQDAGSRRVLELHGTNRVVACCVCGKEWAPEVVIARYEAGEEAPDCDHCGGPLKSKTISFGQAMPADVMAEAAGLAAEADLFLSIGSSLVVEPAASLPRIACARGARLVLINRTETPLDGSAELIIRDGIGATLGAVMDRIEA